MLYTDTDKTLREAVFSALDDEPRLDAGKVGIAVEDGVVTLSGTLPTFTEKWAAEESVKNVKGVRGIANELRVELAGMHVRDDADIAKTIVEVLRWNDTLPSTIQAEVHDGNVTLHGEVEWAYQRQDALDAVRNVVGVRNMRLDISIQPREVDAVELRRKIASRFQRLAALDTKNVNVKVDRGGVVTLSGIVSSLAESDEAESAAFSIRGTTLVCNELRVSDEEW